MAQSRIGGFAALLKPAVAPLALAFGLFVAYVATLAVPGAWFPIVWVEVLVTPALSAVAAIALALMVTVWFWRRHRLSGAAMLAGFITLTVAASAPDPADSLAHWASGLAQVVAYQHALRQQADLLYQNGYTPVAVMPLDGFGSMTSGIAYDPTGEILLPAGQRSKSWWAVAGQTDLAAADLEAWPIMGSYYSWFHY